MLQDDARFKQLFEHVMFAVLGHDAFVKFEEVFAAHIVTNPS